MPNKEPTNEWEKRFEKELTCSAVGHECCGLAVRGDHQKYIDFISQAIQDAVAAREAELIEKVHQMILKHAKHYLPTDENCQSRIDNLREVIALIKES